MTTPNSSYRYHTLWIPDDFQKEFVGTIASRTNARSAFSRQVDIWWHALCLGVQANERTRLPTAQEAKLVNFNDAGVLESDPWRITHLELLVLGEQGEDAAMDAANVILTANEYAMTGFRILADELRGQVNPELHLFARIK